MTFIVGLTGGIASGKSSVSSILSKYFPIIDADKISHIIEDNNKELLKKMISIFGPQVVKNDCLDRKELGSIVFNDKNKLKQLNNIMFPLIYNEIMKEIYFFNKNNIPIVIFDAPLLFEQNYQRICNFIVVVYADEQKQIERLMKRNKISNKDAILRIKSQMPLFKKKLNADFLINNNGTIFSLKNQTYKLIFKLNHIIF